MASAVVAYVTKRLGDLLIQEALFLYGVDDDVEWIRTELTRMQCFLKDADSREKKDERVKNWVAEIIDASYRAEDVIETFICNQSLLTKRRGFSEWVKRCVCIIGELISRRNVGKEIERIKLKIEEISKSRQTFGIRDINEGRQEASSSTRLQERRRFSTELEETQVIGLQEEMNAVRVQLMNGEQRRCVISIVGMGGSGKTTLAKKVYDDVKDNFDCHAFVYLSEQYEIKEVLVNIIECVKSPSPEEIEKIKKMNVRELGRMLRDHLRAKKYLVVIDDIWSIEAWDALKLIFQYGTSKSRVLLTTRNKEVALHADPSSHPHEMRLLNRHEGWELFMKKIFSGENPSTACPSNLKVTGRKILAKCGGPGPGQIRKKIFRDIQRNWSINGIRGKLGSDSFVRSDHEEGGLAGDDGLVGRDETQAAEKVEGGAELGGDVGDDEAGTANDGFMDVREGDSGVIKEEIEDRVEEVVGAAGKKMRVHSEDSGNDSYASFVENSSISHEK
ncbi:hypothetical protein AAC387_Pa07g0391 [Persea americana]